MAFDTSYNTSAALEVVATYIYTCSAKDVAAAYDINVVKGVDSAVADAKNADAVEDFDSI